MEIYEGTPRFVGEDMARVTGVLVRIEIDGSEIAAVGGSCLITARPCSLGRHVRSCGDEKFRRALRKSSALRHGIARPSGESPQAGEAKQA